MTWRRYFQRRRRDEDLAREIESYVAHEIDDNIARGMNEDEARYAAQQRALNLLIVTEIACTVLLLITAGLLMRSFSHLRSTDPGFSTARVLSLHLAVNRDGGSGKGGHSGREKGVSAVVTQ